MKVPKIPPKTTQAKSKVTKPDDDRRGRSVSLKASSSKRRPDRILERKRDQRS